MATITASPNPAGVYSAAVGQPVTIEWESFEGGFGNPPIQSKVAVLVNGVPTPPDLPNPGPTGRETYRVTTPNAYTFILRRVDNNAELARVDVSTYDLRKEIVAGFAGAYVPDLRPQIITDVKVRPGIDTVHISFKTLLPTIPTTEIRDDSGAWVDGKLPLFGGLRTRHSAVFGFEEALALNTKHSFKIEAFGRPGQPKAVLNGEFITGTRNVNVFFDELDMHDDGDSGGAGEFRIAFVAGDVGTGAQLGPSAMFRGDISDNDPPIRLDKSLSLTGVHRQLWLQVVAHENDDLIGIKQLMAPGYDGPGGKYRDDGGEEIVRLTIIADVDTDPGETTIGFELRTGDWPVDFVVTGHLDVTGIEGSVISPKMAKPARIPGRSAFLTSPGDVGALHLAGAGGRAAVVALGADGAVYHRFDSVDRSKRAPLGGWTRLELPGRGAPVAIASAADRLDLVDLDERGGVLHCSVQSAKRGAAKWRKLGGNFRHVVPLAEGGGKGKEGDLLLFGIAEDGDLFVRGAGSEGRDWQRLGDRPVTAIAPLAGTGPGAALFAAAADGSILHIARSRGRWSSQAMAAPPGSVKLLTAASFARPSGKSDSGGADVVIGALGDDHQVRILRWPDYPGGSPPGRWEELGPLQDLIFAEPAAKRSKR